jgi:hypothetical protein
MKITDFLVVDENGEEISADPHGNNLAFCCMKCGHPILAVALGNQRGSDEHTPHPAEDATPNISWTSGREPKSSTFTRCDIAPDN